MKEDKFFILSKEQYLIDIIANEKETLNFDSPEYENFIKQQLNILHNNKNVINYDEDIAFIYGLSYAEAVSLFGESVLNYQQTKYILAEMIAEKYEIDYIDIEGRLNLFFPVEELKTKEDIDEWIEFIVNDIKNTQLFAIVG